MSEVLFFCRLPGRARVLKNGKKIIYSRKHRRRIPVPSDIYARWATVAKLFLARAISRPCIETRVNMCAKFYFKNKAHWPDLSNAYQGIEDLLQECGAIKNDRQIGGHDGSRLIFDPEGPERVEITLTPLAD